MWKSCGWAELWEGSLKNRLLRSLSVHQTYLRQFWQLKTKEFLKNSFKFIQKSVSNQRKVFWASPFSQSSSHNFFLFQEMCSFKWTVELLLKNPLNLYILPTFRGRSCSCSTWSWTLFYFVLFVLFLLVRVFFFISDTDLSSKLCAFCGFLRWPEIIEMKWRDETRWTIVCARFWLLWVKLFLTGWNSFIEKFDLINPDLKLE